MSGKRYSEELMKIPNPLISGLENFRIARTSQRL